MLARQNSTHMPTDHGAHIDSSEGDQLRALPVLRPQELLGAHLGVAEPKMEVPSVQCGGLCS